MQRANTNWEHLKKNTFEKIPLSKKSINIALNYLTEK
jgi:hypothetical protein